jgi:uncharacterized membrane protein
MHQLKRDRGSVLLLFPAALLITLVLASIAVDSAIVYLRQREAYNVAYDAANDAATLAIDRARLDATGEIAIDADRAVYYVLGVIEGADIDGLVVRDVQVVGTTVSVTVTYRVDRIFASVVPGTDERTEHEITATVIGETR